MKQFSEDMVKFSNYFDSDDKCYQYLANIKWRDGFVCKKCGHTTYVERDKHSRMCTLCKTIESPTSGSFFHKLKFSIRKAFLIIFELTTNPKPPSALSLAKRYELNYKTALRFTHKVRQAMGQGNDPMLQGIIEIARKVKLS